MVAKGCHDSAIPAKKRAPKVAADHRMARSAWGGKVDTTKGPAFFCSLSGEDGKGRTDELTHENKSHLWKRSKSNRCLFRSHFEHPKAYINLPHLPIFPLGPLGFFRLVVRLHNASLVALLPTLEPLRKDLRWKRPLRVHRNLRFRVSSAFRVGLKGRKL